MDSLLKQTAEACRPKVKGFPVMKGKPQNLYIFQRTRTSGVYELSGVTEYDAAYGSSVEVAETYLNGKGWEIFSVTKA